MPAPPGASGVTSFDCPASAGEIARLRAELAEARRDLADLDARHHAFLEQSPVPIARFDREGRYRYANPALALAMSRSPADLLGKTLREAGLPTVLCQAWEAGIREVWERGRTTQGEFSIEEDRGPATYLWRMYPERDHQGVVVGVLGVCHDTTAQRKAEEDYRLLFERMVDGLALLEPVVAGPGPDPLDLRFQAVNPAFERLTGAAAPSLLGRGVRQAMPSLAPVLLDIYRQVATEGRPRQGEYSSPATQRHFLLTAFLAAQGRLAAIFMDRTAQKLAEEARGESEERFRRLVENAPDAIFVQTEDRFAYVNAATLQMLGATSPAQLLGSPILDRVHPAYRHFVRDRMDYLRRDKRRASPMEQVYLRLDGGEVAVETSAVPLRYQGHDGALVFVRGIGERQAAQQAAQASEERLAQVIEFLPDATLVIDREGKVLLWNRAMEELTGLPAARIVGQGGHAYAEPFYGHRRPVLVDMVLKADEELAKTYPNFRDDGERLVAETRLDNFRDRKEPTYLWIAASRLRDPEGRVVGAIESIRDVTQVRLAEMAKGRLENQLRQAQKMEAVGTMAGGIAHNFNNILSAIMGFADLAMGANQEGRDPQRELGQIVSAAERAKDLVRRILTFSRKLEIELKPLDLNQEIRHILRILERTLPKMISIETRLPEDLWRIDGDAGQIAQVLLNLATNAQDAMPEGGKLAIQTQNLVLGPEFCRQHMDMCPGPHVLLSVRDTGQGMDERTREQIFDPFFTTKEVGKGTGLGLSIVYGIVKGHHGQVICESRPGRGTVFDIYFPALEGEEVAETPSAEADPGDLTGEERILLVDDDPALRELGARALGDLGYRVSQAASGEEALVIFQLMEPRPDLVILDLGMPGMGGGSCLRKLLALDSATRVLIASGYAFADQVRESLEAGAVGFVAKPFRLKELAAQVRRALDEVRA